MEWPKFAPLFHESYHSKIRKWVESEDCDKLYAFLKSESMRGVKIAPLSNLTFRCFQETPLNEIRCILSGFSPYHTFINGSPVCDGLLMGCSITEKLQPSLRAFYQGVEKELYDGLNLSYNPNPDISYLAKQGVLMYNTSLTVPKDKAGAHLVWWEGFNKFFFEEVVGYSGIPIILMGKETWKVEKYITPFTHIFKISHPAYFARMDQPLDTEGVLTKVNKIIEGNNGKSFTIKWLDTYED